MSILKSITNLIFILSVTTTLCAQADTPPQHFFNAPEHINSNPDYVPGEYALADTHSAKTYYFSKKEELISQGLLLDPQQKITTGLGSITFSNIKNETAKVLGYFRNYSGSLSTKGMNITGLQLVIDINSLDTAVPGRNNRIMDIFFQSLKPELGTAIINFTDIKTKSLQKNSIATAFVCEANGTIDLNGVTKPIQAKLQITDTNGTWTVELQSPLSLYISDFGYENNVYSLMKACNHKSISNEVEINAKIYLR